VLGRDQVVLVEDEEADVGADADVNGATLTMKRPVPAVVSMMRPMNTTSGGFGGVQSGGRVDTVGSTVVVVTALGSGAPTGNVVSTCARAVVGLTSKNTPTRTQSPSNRRTPRTYLRPRRGPCHPE